MSQDFLGQLYRFVSLDLDTHRRISYASLEQYQHCVRTLIYPRTVIFGRGDWIGLAHCKQLLQLDLSLDNYFRLHYDPDKVATLDKLIMSNEYDEETDLLLLGHTDRFMTLIRQSPQLQILKKNWRTMSLFHTSQFSQQLVQHPNLLVSLHLTSSRCGYNVVTRLLNNSPRLERLHQDDFILQQDRKE